jgi:hypothetical protein
MADYTKTYSEDCHARRYVFASLIHLPTIFFVVLNETLQKQNLPPIAKHLPIHVSDIDAIALRLNVAPSRDIALGMTINKFAFARMLTIINSSSMPHNISIGRSPTPLWGNTHWREHRDGGGD